MRIIQFTAENVKKLKAVSIKPDGSLVQITGANGQGKSSILDAIFYALGGTKGLPSQPVRHGEEKAFVKLDLGEIVVTRRFTANGGTSLTVEAANGAKFPSPQKMLDDLLGALTFDPLEFSRMQPKQQLETLRGLVPLRVDIDALDAHNKFDYEARTACNRMLKELQAHRDALTPVPADTPTEPVDVVALVTELNEALAWNKERQHILQENQRSLESWRETKEHAKQRLEEAEAAIAHLHAGVVAPEISTTELFMRVSNVRAVNDAVARNKEHAELNIRILSASETANKLTKLIDTRTSDKIAAIASAKMPVEGLAFGEGEIIFNGVPFAQASSAEQLRVSVAIAMAANPKLRVLRIRDGSLLDENSLALVEWLAEEHDFQVWIERVDTSGLVGVVIEDGSVVKQ